jgi:sulfite reductase (ferredoxin)
MACPALPTCPLALAEAERALPAVLTELEAELERLGLADERFTVRMTGCPNGCARPYTADIAFVGRSLDKYAVYAGGNLVGTRLNHAYADLVRTADLVSAVRPLLERYREERLPGEALGDFAHRVQAQAAEPARLS